MNKIRELSYEELIMLGKFRTLTQSGRQAMLESAWYLSTYSPVRKYELKGPRPQLRLVPQSKGST